MNTNYEDVYLLIKYCAKEVSSFSEGYSATHEYPIVVLPNQNIQNVYYNRKNTNKGSLGSIITNFRITDLNNQVHLLESIHTSKGQLKTPYFWILSQPFQQKYGYIDIEKMKDVYVDVYFLNIMEFKNI